MKIGLDISSGLSSQPTGVGVYILQLARHLAKIDRENEYFLYTRGKKKISFQEVVNVRFYNLRSPRVFFQSVNIFHGLAFKLRFWPRAGRRVVTVHDMSPFSPDRDFNPPDFARMQKTIRKATARADSIIVSSESVRQEIIHFLSVEPEIVRVVHHGLDEHFHPVEDETKIKQLKDKLHLPNEFILFVGTLEARKNLVRLIEAFSKFTAENRNSPPLLLVGRKGRNWEEIFERVSSLNLNSKVHYSGYFQREDLPLLYSACLFFVYPSLCEGFGIPVLEAMGCGAAVLTSSISALPEVVGDAAYLVNPYKVEEIREGIEKLFFDQDLRKKLKEKGLSRAKNFTWEKSAQRTLEIYQSLFQQ
ncbi:MAG: glycosyltransferase family 1 protein [Candidatus Edwardsbacteria bacterium]